MELTQEKLDRICLVVETYAKLNNIFPMIYLNYQVIDPWQRKLDSGRDFDTIHEIVQGTIYTTFIEEITKLGPVDEVYDKINNLYFEVLRELQKRDIIVNKNVEE